MGPQPPAEQPQPPAEQPQPPAEQPQPSVSNEDQNMPLLMYSNSPSREESAAADQSGDNVAVPPAQGGNDANQPPENAQPPPPGPPAERRMERNANSGIPEAQPEFRNERVERRRPRGNLFSGGGLDGGLGLPYEDQAYLN